MTSASSKKVITDNYSSEEATSNIAKFKAVQVNDAQYEEKMAASAIKNTLEKDGVKAEKNAALLQVGDKELSHSISFFTFIRFKRMNSSESLAQNKKTTTTKLTLGPHSRCLFTISNHTTNVPLASDTG